MRKLLIFFSHVQKKNEGTQKGSKEGTGTIWLSGGLCFCAKQIRLDRGDTLIVVNNAEIMQFSSGDNIQLKHRETGNKNSGCDIGIECEILEVKNTD